MQRAFLFISISICTLFLCGCASDVPRETVDERRGLNPPVGMKSVLEQRAEVLHRWGGDPALGYYNRDDRRAYLTLYWNPLGYRIDIEIFEIHKKVQYLTLAVRQDLMGLDAYYGVYGGDIRKVGTASLMSNGNAIIMNIIGSKTPHVIELGSDHFTWNRPDGKFRFEKVPTSQSLAYTGELRSLEAREQRAASAPPDWLVELTQGLQAVATDLESQNQAAREREQEQLIRLSGLGSKSANASNRTGVFAAQNEPSAAADRPASSDVKPRTGTTGSAKKRSSIDTSHSTDSSQDAARRDDAQRRIAEGDERIRKNREMERIAREQSSKRYEETQRELAAANEKARKERQKQSDLDRLQSRIIMAAKQCGNGDVRVGGILPASARQFEHLRVEFTVYCPGNTSVRGAISNFLGDGYSCVGSDMVQVQIPCDAREARVVVDKVAGSN